MVANADTFTSGHCIAGAPSTPMTVADADARRTRR
jgi:hypothetical protein